MGKLKKRFGILAYQTILTMTAFLSVLICAGSFAVAQEKIFKKMFSPFMRILLPAILAVMICLFVAVIYQRLERFGQRQLKTAALLLFGIIAAVYVIVLFNFKSIPFSDALNIQDGAMYFVRTGDRPLSVKAPHADYFGKFSNNYFLTIVFSWLFRILSALHVKDIYFPLLLLSAAAMLTATVFMYLIGVRIRGLCGGVKILVLCALNPVYYVLVLWVYTNVMSLPFMMAVVYFGICIYQEKNGRKRVIYGVLTAVCSVVGYFIRPTVVIPLIAFIICAFLWGADNRERVRMLFRCAVVCAVVGGIVFAGISRLNERYFSSVSDQNFPVTHWIMMASHGTGKHVDADSHYTAQFDTKTDKLKATVRRAAHNYLSYSPSGLVSFLCDKLIVSWSYGDGGDIMDKAAQDVRQTRLYPWILGERSDLLRLYCYAFRIANLILIVIAILNLLGRRKIEPYQFLFVLTFFGGILFYSLWEIKASYGLPFVNIMLLIGMQGGDVLAGNMERMLAEKGKTQQYRFCAATALLCVFCVSVIGYHKMTATEAALKDYSICSIGKSSTENIDTGGSGLVLTQEFSASKKFNRIAFRGEADKAAVQNNDSFQVTLFDGDGQAVFACTVFAGEIKKDACTVIKTNEITPRGTERYTLQFAQSEPCQGEMYLKQRRNEYIDTYDGTLTVNGKERNNDLYLQVYQKTKPRWCSKAAAFAINGGLFAAAVLLCLLLCGRKRLFGNRKEKLDK